MAYSQEVLSRAQARLAQARQEQQETYALHLEEAYRQYPRLREIDRALRGTMAEVIAAAFRSGEDPGAALAGIREKNLALQQEREWILDAAEFEDGFLDDTPICAKCGGSGYVGSAMCDCLQELCRQEQKKELSSLIGSGRERFSGFRLDKYSERVDPQCGISPRALMERNLRRCRSYAETFTQLSPSLLFSGTPGLGKTFLSGCIARVVADRGFSVVYETVVQIVSDFEADKFGESTDESRRRLQKYTACDLLIIDDLGTEMVTQFSQSALYTVINSRMIDCRPTIVSTNFSTEEIRARYSPQLASRLRGAFELVQFLGDDIRLQGKL